MASSKRARAASLEEPANQLIEFGGFGSLENVIGLGAVTRKLKPLQQAQELCHDAREAATKDKRIALAKKALALSPLCADAYTILGEHVEKGSDLQLELYETALEAGRKAIGEKFETLRRRVLGAARNPAFHACEACPGQVSLGAGRAGRKPQPSPRDAGA